MQYAPYTPSGDSLAIAALYANNGPSGNAGGDQKPAAAAGAVLLTVNLETPGGTRTLQLLQV